MNKPYVNGEMRRVRLVPEEAVLAACLGFEVGFGPFGHCSMPDGVQWCLSPGGS